MITTLGGMIHTARVSRRLTLANVADSLEITPMYLSQIENNRRFPLKEEILRKFADYFSLSFDELYLVAVKTKDYYMEKDISHPDYNNKVLLHRKIDNIKNISLDKYEKIVNILEEDGK